MKSKVERARRKITDWLDHGSTSLAVIFDENYTLPLSEHSLRSPAIPQSRLHTGSE